MDDVKAAETLDDGRLTVHHDFVWLLHRHDLDSFESFYEDRAGKLLRDVGPRANVLLTLEADGEEKRFYLKRHVPLGIRDKLLAWLRLRRPRTAARVEWENVERLRALGIATMQPVVLGEDPDASGRSFVMTAEIESAAPADDFAVAHLRGDANVHHRREFVRQLGELVRKFHTAGLTHRDLYLCHVFVRKPEFEGLEEGLQLHLIDLQRLGPRVFKWRWRVKDVAQLAYSQPDGTFTRTDAIRFLHAYFGTHRLGPRHKRFAGAVRRKVARMKRRIDAMEKRT